IHQLARGQEFRSRSRRLWCVVAESIAAPRVTGSNRGPTMLTILHISDLHFGPPYLPDVGAAALRFAAELNADVIAASGDFTQRPKVWQFAAARAFLDRLPPAQLVTVPGNHDVALYRVVERLLRPFANYRRHIAPELDTITRRDDAVIVALNSAAPRT